mmetsp:Transcript_10583/g.21307  ORF Transcript_10583/g.21307 Transcript_10583/m.21307 type:complete len:302 (+) Transcript_10583:138-1043(+)
MLVLRCVALLGSIDAINKPSNRVVLYCIVWYGMVLHCIVCCFVPRPVPSRPGKTTLYARCVLASHKGRCDQRKDRCQTTTTPTTVHAVTGCTRDDRNGGNNVDVDVHRVRHLVLCFVQKGVVHSNVKFGHGSPLGFGRRENRSGGGRSKNRGVCHQRPPRRSGRLTDGRGTRTGNGRRRNQIVVVGVVAVSLVVDTIQPIVIVIVIVNDIVATSRGAGILGSDEWIVPIEDANRGNRRGHHFDSVVVTVISPLFFVERGRRRLWYPLGQHGLDPHPDHFSRWVDALVVVVLCCCCRCCCSC